MRSDALRAALAILVLAAAEALAAALLFRAAPSGEVLQDSLVSLHVIPAPPAKALPSGCGLFRGGAPAGPRLAGHPDKVAAAEVVPPDSTGTIFRFRPSDTAAGGGKAALALGSHFLVVACGDGDDVTPELPLLVVTPRAATVLTPKAQEPSSAPSFSWTAVPGVPAYHLLLSDQALQIDTEKGQVGGASVIWQAITTRTAIAYGTPDPSGNFAQVAPPPLSPGVTYNLVILNNYDGRSALATSSKAQALKLFSLQAPASALPKPRNLSPAPGATLSVSTDSAVTLRWSASRGTSGPANTYKAYLYSLEEEDGSEILVPIWSAEVTDTTAALDGRRTLLSKKYVWKVFALGEAGTGVVGDTTSFSYRNDVQTLGIEVSGPSGPLSDVRVALTPLDGGASPIPLFTPSGGRVEKVLAVGGYTLGFSKDGYVAQARTVTLSAAAPVHLEVTLAEAANRLSGRVTDAGGLPLDNVEVTAASGAREVSAFTDAQGAYLLGLPAGTHALSFRKADHLSPADTLIVLKSGEARDLGRTTLARAQGALSGTVANDKGAAIPACQVQIRTSAGAVLRTLLTDDRGGFSAFLAPGAYIVSASRTGFATEEKPVRLVDAATVSFTLAPGASIVKGVLSARAWRSASSSAAAPLPGADLELKDLLAGTVRKTRSDLRGEFAFSADTGTFLLKATAAGRALPDSALVRIAAPRSTVTRDLELRALAAVQGTVALSPAAPWGAAPATVSLLSLPSLQVAATARAASDAGATGPAAFSLEGVPDGSYRVSAGYAGHGPDAEPGITVKDGVWVAGLALVLRPAAKSLGFDFRHGIRSVQGAARVAAPVEAEVPAGGRLAPAAPGTYVLAAEPDSAALLPLARVVVSLPASGAADTTVALPFPFSHEPPAELAFAGGEVKLTLGALRRIDSAWVIHGYGTATDTLAVPRDVLAAGFDDDPRTLSLRPGPEGGLLTYWFVVKAGGLTWSNEAPARRFRARVSPSPALAFLRVSAGDSLPLPEKSAVPLTVHAYDAAGRRLDSAVDRRGTVRWRTGALAARVERRAGRALTLATGAAPAARPKRAAGSAGAGAAEAWDTLAVEVELDGVTRVLPVPARVVTARINRLVLAGTLGETPEIPAPADFGLLPSAFDTTTTPPTPLVPSPAYALDPPEAGRIEEGRVVLSPRFIGPLRVTAVHRNPDGSRIATELGAGRDSLLRGLNVGQTLAPGDTARLFVHDRQFEVRVPDSALAGEGQAVLRLYRRSVSKTFASGVTEALAGRLHELSNPSGAPFVRAPRINLGIPPAYRDRSHALRRFEAASLSWRPLGPAAGDTAAADVNAFGDPSLAGEAHLLDGSYYGLLGRSRPLSAGSLEIVPNPFSPLVTAARDGNTQPGTRIRLRPESDRSPEVTVSIRIYNLDGELVRILVDHKTVPKQVTDFYWDGKADGGRWARNGRYLVKISLSAPGERRTRHLVEPVVVFR